MEAYGSLSLSWAQGYKGDELCHVDLDTICYACGNAVKFLDVKNSTETSFLSEGNGVKKLTANPFESVFAIAEHGINPRIFVYQYPSFELVCTLTGGAELEYTNLAFSSSSTFIAACSGLPEFSLFLWNWSDGELKCSEKLLGEDFNSSLLFNPLNHLQLSLIGPESVTVWTVENCNDIMSLKAKKVDLPSVGGILHRDDDSDAARSVTRFGYQLHIPASVKAGLIGNKANDFTPSSLKREFVKPTAQCWSSRGEVFVGCKGGQLFRVDGESGQSAVILGGTSDRILQGEIEPEMFTCMAMNSRGIFAGGADQYFRVFTINNDGIQIEKVWKASQTPTTLTFDPKNYAEFFYGTDVGVIFKYSVFEPGSTIVAESHCGRFIGVTYGASGQFCVTCREDGDVQVWDSQDGDLVGGLQLNDQVTSMAYCPSSPVMVVGSSSGFIRYIDTTSLHGEEVDLRQVYAEKFHHGPVSFLKYDIYGTFLLSASKDENYIFIFNAKPSAKFKCIGYVDCGGAISDVSVYAQEQKYHVLVTLTLSPLHKNISNEIVYFCLSASLINDAGDHHFKSLRQDYRDEVINFTRFFLTASLDSAVITGLSDAIDVAAISRHNKKLLRFALPLSKDVDPDDIYSPVSEHPGHQLGNAKLFLSFDRTWLASSSKDGSLTVRDLQNWDSCVSITAHSFMKDGTRDFALSPDAKYITSVGMDDQSLCCFAWNLTERGSVQANNAVEFARALNMRLRNTMEAESEVLYDMAEWKSPPQKPGDHMSTTGHDTKKDVEDEKTSRSAVSDSVAAAEALPADDVTWLDAKMAKALREENSKYDEEKENLLVEINKLRETILERMKVNASLPELEQLRHDEYNLDLEEQKRMQAEQDKQIQEVRDEINLENIAQRYLAYLIKKECWDDMDTKGRALKTFNHNVTVTNYPTVVPTPEEELLLQAASRQRKTEIAEISVRKTIVDATASKTSAVGEEEDEEEDDRTVGLALHGSLGPKFNGDSDLFYSQFELHSREQKMIQITLIKNAICRVKDAFNKSFNTVFKNKEQEIARIKERNVRIRTIMHELDVETFSVVDPEMDNDEMPEKTFVVADSEVAVERVLSEEQKRELEQQERLEEERKAAAKGENKRERALMDMMGGVLEVKKEDILKQDIPLPEFATEKLEKDWTDEEKKKMKEYEKKMKELQEEREKYRKNLENELKKLQQSNVDGMAAFDESLAGLFNKKVKIEMVLHQEELKILRLTKSLITDDELSTYERHLNHMFDLKNILQTKSAGIEAEIRKKVEEYREYYDSVSAEDKMLDRSFKRDFSDIPLSLSDQLYKLFKRRPRLQRPQKSVEDKVTFDPFGLTDKTAFLPHDGDNKSLLLALSELDHESHIPDGVDESLWQRLCDSRRAKYESELRVKNSALVMAEMTQYLQFRQDELERLTKEIDDVIKQQNKLYEDMMKNTLNLEVQLLLKQGQVEVACGQFIPDYSDSILVHRGVVEDLNGTIRTLGESKVTAMTESKDFKKGIHQLEWERRKMIMQMEDLNNKARHIQILKLTKEIQAFLNEENHAARHAKEIAVLEQTLVLLDKQLEGLINHKSDQTSQLTRKIRMKEEENKELDKILEELHVSVSERQNIAVINAAERAKNTADKRLRGIVQRRKLVDLAKAQAQEVAVLRAEVERLRMKTFPALVQVER